MTNRNVHAGLAAALAAVLLIAGCSPKSDNNQAAAANNVKLTPEQRRNIKLYTVAQSKFRKTFDTTGVVDFDNDQATIMLAPFSGPVSRLLVSPGDQVKKGDPLAMVSSPDYAAALGTYRKTLAAASNARRLADVDKDLLEHQIRPVDAAVRGDQGVDVEALIGASNVAKWTCLCDSTFC